MYKVPIIKKSKLRVNASVEGEMLETKVERVMTNKEGIKDGAPIIHTERSQGVVKAYNIRTDRFEVAIEAMDKVAGSYQARRENSQKMAKEDGKAESTQETKGEEPTK